MRVLARPATISLARGHAQSGTCRSGFSRVAVKVLTWAVKSPSVNWPTKMGSIFWMMAESRSLGSSENEPDKPWLHPCGGAAVQVLPALWGVRTPRLQTRFRCECGQSCCGMVGLAFHRRHPASQGLIKTPPVCAKSAVLRVTAVNLSSMAAIMASRSGQESGTCSEMHKVAGVPCVRKNPVPKLQLHAFQPAAQVLAL